MAFSLNSEFLVILISSVEGGTLLLKLTPVSTSVCCTNFFKKVLDKFLSLCYNVTMLEEVSITICLV